jgi:phage terminase large subunit GpA-like protein
MPKWLPLELQAFKPPENLTVSEWADKYRILDARSSARPGRWKTSTTPYLREIMDRFTDATTERIIMMVAAQTGKSETLFNALGFAVDQDQAPAMIVYPTVELGEWTYDNRIKPFIQASPALNTKYLERSSRKNDIQFLGMGVAISGANSAASLSSRPIRYLFMDEVDKYPPYLGEEGDPESLAEERTKSFWNKKIFKVSTPTTTRGRVYKNYQSADVRLKYFVPCPHCGHEQELRFRQIKWTDELKDEYKATQGDPQKIARVAQAVLASAWYECESCGGRIDDRHKPEMLRLGHWVSDEDPDTPPRNVAYHLSSLYAPWVTWGDVAAEFLQSKPFPEKLRNFINSWLGEPWEERIKKTDEWDRVSKEGTHERGIVPKDGIMLTAAVDVQKDHFWYEVKAWGVGITSWTVDYGVLDSWEEVEDVIVNGAWTREGDAAEMIIRLAAIDSGFRTDEVYEFCSAHADVCVATKGSSKPLKAPYTRTTIEQDNTRTKFKGSLSLYLIDTGYYKDFIFARLEKAPTEPGAWSVFKECPDEYWEQILSEQKVIKLDRKKGVEFEEWVKLSQHIDNHLLDCAVGNAFAAERAGVRHLSEEVEAEERIRSRHEAKRERKRKSSSWATGGKAWVIR